jgi:SAM-dependent methyltransferase
MKSYSGKFHGLPVFFQEAVELYRAHATDMPEKVRRLLDQFRAVEHQVRGEWGMGLENLRILDIGPGQQLTAMIWFSRRNEVVGIDLDVVAQRFNPVTIVRMLRSNGVVRTVKTTGRKAFGLDRRHWNEVMRQLELESLPDLRVHQMDAREMTFSDESFDFVYSRVVFEHVADPGAAIDEIVRVLRPGGVAYIRLHLYTSPGGSHDPRLLSGRGIEAGMWPHLRPELEHEVRPHAYLNELRLHEWQELFSSRMPGVRFFLDRGENRRYEQHARALKSGGALSDFDLDELLSDALIATWKKPDHSPSMRRDTGVGFAEPAKPM